MSNDSLLFRLKSSDVWDKDFRDIDDVLDRGIMKCEDIPSIHKAVINIIRTGDMLKSMNEEFLKMYDLTFAQQSILESLFFSNRDYLTQNELSRFIFSSKANVSSVLDKLEAKGLVLREENPENKREKKISITSEGISLLEKVVSTFEENSYDGLLTEEESNQLNEITTKLRNIFSNSDLKKMKKFEKR